MQTSSYRLSVRDRLGFLRRVMMQLAGDARMSLEGNLSGSRFPEDLVVTREETAALKRNTLAPKQDFVVVFLKAETVDPILEQVAAIGLTRAIIHVQIERGGIIELAAYDNFHPEGVVTGPGIDSKFLTDLKDEGVLQGFVPAK